MTTSASTLVIRRARVRSWSRRGRTRVRRMSPAPSPEPVPTRGFVATEAKVYSARLAISVPAVLARQRSAALLLIVVTAVPRLVALLYERGSIVDAFTEKGDVFARTLLSDGTYGFIPGHASAYTQPLYGFFLVPLYWIFGRHWPVVGLAQIAVACGTTLIVWRIGRRWLSPAAGLLAGLLVAVHPYLVWHD